ncbi:MAG: hypothetical protein Q9168_006184, partial [Polycauliona sp. 1 TL-2023]
MALRRSSGGDGDGPSGIGNTPWGQTIELGWGFGDPYDRAHLVFQIIGLVGIVAIIIWAMTIEKSHEPNKKLFKWWAFWLSAIAIFVYMAINFTVTIIFAVAEKVQIVFLLVITIIYELSYLADISLLLALYILLPYCTPYPSRTGDKPRMAKNLRIVHGLLLLLLMVLRLIALASRIQGQVEVVIGDPYDYRLILRNVGRIATTYAILLVFGALEILGWSVMGLIKKRPRHGKTHLILLSSIALPLLLRSLYIMADAIHTNLLGHLPSEPLLLATDLIYNLLTIVIYAGIVAIARSFATNSIHGPGAGADAAMYDLNHDWNGPGLPPHDS